MADETNSSFKINYHGSRDTFLEELAGQVSLSTGANLYDRNGKISRMVIRGDSQNAITNELMKNSIFKANYESMEQEAGDVFEGISKLRFAEFNNALKNIVDPKEAPDYKATALELIGKYDENGSVSELINSGATAYEVLKELDKSPVWKDELIDYKTSADVEVPSDVQLSKWDAFYQTVAAIKDLDDYQEASEASL